jgi:hypothetical protein
MSTLQRSNGIFTTCHFGVMYIWIVLFLLIGIRRAECADLLLPNMPAPGTSLPYPVMPAPLPSVNVTGIVITAGYMTIDALTTGLTTPLIVLINGRIAMMVPVTSVTTQSPAPPVPLHLQIPFAGGPARLEFMTGGPLLAPVTSLEVTECPATEAEVDQNPDLPAQP